MEGVGFQGLPVAVDCVGVDAVLLLQGLAHLVSDFGFGFLCECVFVFVFVCLCASLCKCVSECVNVGVCVFPPTPWSSFKALHTLFRVVCE